MRAQNRNTKTGLQTRQKNGMINSVEGGRDLEGKEERPEGPGKDSGKEPDTRELFTTIVM